MSRNGPFSNARGSSWVRRASKSGRYLWGPSDPTDGLVVGGGTESSESENAYFDSTGNRLVPKMFFDAATASFRVGTLRRIVGFPANITAWDKVNRGYGSIAIGTEGPTASGTNAIYIGNGGSATNTRSIGIGLSTTSSGQDTVAIGSSSSATATNAMAFGQTAAATSSSALALGNGATASGSSSAAMRGTASGANSVTIGSGAAATRHSQLAISGTTGFSAVGDAQSSLFHCTATTTDAIATELVLGSQASTYITIGATRTMCFDIKVSAHRTDVSGTAAAWPSIKGAITRDSSGNCRLLGSVTGASTTTFADAGGTTWSIAVTADSTNNRLAITVTGETAKTIRWVASVLMAEVG